jgi:hypothetical protein
VRRRVGLHSQTEKREVADRHPADVEHDAVEVEEDSLAQQDVGALVAEERLHPDRAAPPAEQRGEDAAAGLAVGLAGGVSGPAQAPAQSRARASSGSSGSYSSPTSIFSRPERMAPPRSVQPRIAPAWRAIRKHCHTSRSAVVLIAGIPGAT